MWYLLCNIDEIGIEFIVLYIHHGQRDEFGNILIVYI
jgi:hypothetical protein